MMQYTNKVITLAMLCSVYSPTSFTCSGCSDKLQAQCNNNSIVISEPAKTGETIDCSCSQPRPPKPATKQEATVDCSCSQPRPVAKPPVKEEAIVDCSCSQPRPAAKPPVKEEAIVDCSCSQPRPTPKPVAKPVVKENVCPYAEVEEIINGLAEKITAIKNKVETFADKEKVALIIKDLDAILDTLEVISNSDLTPEQAKSELLEIKSIIDQVEAFINAL